MESAPGGLPATATKQPTSPFRDCQINLRHFAKDPPSSTKSTWLNRQISWRESRGMKDKIMFAEQNHTLNQEAPLAKAAEFD